MYILIIEDNKVAFETLQNSLNNDETFSRLYRIERIKTELEFREKFERIASNPPSIIILDIMLKWASKNRFVEPPTEIKKEGFYRAGFRCEKMLATDWRTRNIPIIVYSGLEPDDSRDYITPRSQITYLNKDFNARKIIEILLRLRS